MFKHDINMSLYNYKIMFYTQIRWYITNIYIYI